MKKSSAAQGQSASELISKRIADLGDWRGSTLARMRELIREADPDVVEEWKWMGTPIWSHDGILCTGESYRSVVKLTFAKGASLQDPDGLFNASLDGNVRRAIDIHEDEQIDASAFKALVREAVAFNSSGKSKPKAPAKAGARAATKAAPKPRAQPTTRSAGDDAADLPEPGVTEDECLPVTVGGVPQDTTTGTSTGGRPLRTSHPLPEDVPGGVVDGCGLAPVPGAAGSTTITPATAADTPTVVAP